MEFLKKNYAKIILTVLLVAVAAFALVAAFNALAACSSVSETVEAIAGENIKGGFCARSLTYFGVALSSLCIAASYILKMLNMKKVSSYVLLAGGAVATVLIVVAVFAGSGYLKELADAVKAAKEGIVGTHYPTAEFKDFAIKAAQTQYSFQLCNTVIMLLTFGLVPVAMGVKKLCRKCEINKQ